MEIMRTLMGAGVVDTGVALISAAHHGRTTSVKILLQQRDLSTRNGQSYLNARWDRHAALSAAVCGACPRMVRLLLRAC